MEIQPSNPSIQLNTDQQLEPETSNLLDVTLVLRDEKKELNKNQRRILSKL